MSADTASGSLSAGADAPDTPDGRAAESRWEQVLAELEECVTAAAAKPAVPPPAWVAPQDLGPLPDRLASRAAALVRAQAAARTALRRDVDTARRQARLLRAAAPPSPAVYLDVSG